MKTALIILTAACLLSVTGNILCLQELHHRKTMIVQAANELYKLNQADATVRQSVQAENAQESVAGVYVYRISDQYGGGTKKLDLRSDGTARIQLKNSAGYLTVDAPTTWKIKTNCVIVQNSLGFRIEGKDLITLQTGIRWNRER